MTAFRNFAGIAVFRFFMGGFEASIAPSMLVVVAMWWTRREQPLRNNIWYSCNVGPSSRVPYSELMDLAVGYCNDLGQSDQLRSRSYS